jgi:alkylation response protein AidB-like acyl-CoA dehydrogenase
MNAHADDAGANYDLFAAMAEQVQRLLEKLATQEQLRQLLDRPGSFHSSLWRELIDLGALSVVIPDTNIDTPIEWRLLSDLIRLSGRYTVSLPLAAAAVAVDAIRAHDFATANQIAAGRQLVALAVGHAGQDIQTLPTLSQGLVQGSIRSCPFAAVADRALLAVRAADQVSLVWMDCTHPKVSRTTAAALDNARGSATLSFAGAPAVTVGGAEQVERTRLIASLAVAFEQIGGAERCLELACDYARERKAFGQPIGAFQAVKHKLADFYTAIELARGCANAALEDLQIGSSRLRASTSAAVLAATDAFDFAATETIQVFGAIGVTWEARPHHYYVRARTLAVEYGSRYAWRDQLVDALLDRVADPAESENATIADTPIQRFRARARSWLKQNAPAFELRGGESVTDRLTLGRRWQALKAANGYSAITLPMVYGGGGGTDLERIAFAEEELRYDLPTVFFGVSLNMTVPTFAIYASDQAKAKLLPPAIRGEHIWCQLFSEPSVGSDLAGLRLSARRDGTGWRLNGQKIWTSWAQFSDWGYIAARTDPSLPKHKGLTCFYLDMHSPGIDVRPIRRIGCDQEINEVFFSDVYVPDEHRMGEVNGGFAVIMTTLMIERYALNDEFAGGPKLDQFLALVKTATHAGRPACQDGEVRRAIATSYVEWLGQRSIHERAMAKMAAGAEPGPEGSIRKLLAAKARQRLSTVALDVLGRSGLTLHEGKSERNDFAWSWIDVPQLRIAGGTDDILRNTIAERILKLPQDYRPDKGVPFKSD